MLPDSNRVFLAILGVGSAIVAISLLWPTAFWSLAGLDTMPLGFKIGAGILLGLCATPMAGRLCQRIADYLQLHRPVQMMIWLLAGAGTLAIMYFLSSENHALGDGYQILSRTVAGEGGSAFSKLDFYAHHLICIALPGSSDTQALWSYRILAYASGITCWLGIWYFSRRSHDVLLASVLLLAFSAVQFYFGYAEHYTIAFTLLVIYMLSALVDFENNTLSIKTAVLLVLACSFHLLAIVYAPLLVYLAFARIQARWLRMVIGIGSVAAVMAAVLFVATQTTLSSIFVPLAPKGDNPYSLFSGQHLTDLVNVLILNLPLLPALLLTRAAWRGDGSKLILIAIAFPIVFTVVFDPKLGAMRDWDIMCLAMPAVFASILALLRREDTGISNWRWRLIPLLLVFAVLHTGTWIHHNASRQESYQSVKLEVQRDVHYSEYYLKGERLTSWAFIAGSCYNDDREIFRAQHLRVKGDPEDNLTRYNLARNYAIDGDTASAADLLAGKWHAVADRPNITLAVGAILGAARRYDALEALYESAPKTPPHGYVLYAELAALKAKRGVPDTACLYFNYALGTNPNAPLIDKIGIARFWQKNGYEYEAGALVDDTRGLLPPELIPILEQIKSAMFKGRVSETDSLLGLLQGRIAVK